MGQKEMYWEREWQIMPGLAATYVASIAACEE